MPNPPRQYVAPVDEKMAISQLAASLRDGLSSMHVDLQRIELQLNNLNQNLATIAAMRR